MEFSHFTYVFFAIFLCCVYTSSEPIPSTNFHWLNSGSSNKIVGGYKCGSTEVRHQVSLQKSDSHFCGGSAYSKRCALTAAHCVSRVYNPSSISIKCGSTSLLNATGYSVSRIVTNDKYNSNNMQHELAIVKISGEFPASVVPVTLPASVESYDETTKAITSGYGVMSEGGSTIPADCMCVGVPYVPHSQCNASYDGKVYDSMICAGEAGRDSCQGDSGGPLVTENSIEGSYKLIGIVSWGRGCARDGYPGVYTEVCKYLDWIESASRDLECY